MPDSGTKLPENRIHLFDPVGLINDGYGGYRAANYAVRPRRPTKSYDSSADTNNSAGLRSYVSFAETESTVGLTSYDSYADTNGGGLRSYDSFKTETNGGVIGSYDHITKDTDGGGIRLRVKTMVEDESDVSTPRLWNPSSPTSNIKVVSSSPLHPTSPQSVSSSPLNPTSPKSVSSALQPTSPKSVNPSSLQPTSPKSVGSPLHPSHHHYHTMSPNSRTQAIAKGRRELMEMVWDLPESFYELSLKDIVEQRAEMEVQVIDLPEEKKPVKETTKPKETKSQKKSSKKVKKSESKKKMVRSRSVDNGRFLLKTSVFPIFLGSRKTKKNVVGSSSFKIASMPKLQPTPTRSMKAVEKDWWRRRSCISSESDDSNGLSSNSSSSRSSRSSSRSSSSNGRRSNKFFPGCFFFNGRRIRGRK